MQSSTPSKVLPCRTALSGILHSSKKIVLGLDRGAEDHINAYGISRIPIIPGPKNQNVEEFEWFVEPEANPCKLLIAGAAAS